jgi:hypothetical protein
MILANARRPLYRSILSGLLIGLKGEITGSSGVIDRQDRCGLIFIVMLRNQNLPSLVIRI